MQLTGRARIKNQLWRFDPLTGFLRCTAVMLQVSVMPYTAAEIQAPPGTPPNLYLYVPPEQICDPASISSLEGAPAVIGHTWQTSGDDTGRCGSVAGAPYFDGSDLVADLLITDAEAARRIMLPPGDPDKLEEISTGYDAQIVFQPGTAEVGPFDGYFTGIRYNHVAVLPAGNARGGSAVRIVNSQEHPEMDFKKIKLFGRTVRVHNEDADVAEEAAAGKVDGSNLQEMLDKVTELNAQLAELTKQRDELTGQLTALQEQLEAAVNPENVENAAEEIAEQRNDATAVMNAHGKAVPDEMKKLRGHALRVAVLNSVRSAPLSEEDAKNEPFVRGVYSAMSRKAVPAAVPPAGHQVVPVQNELPKVVADMSDPNVRRARMYGEQKK